MVWRCGGEGAIHKIWPGLCSGFRETWVYGRTDGRATDDGRQRHDSSSAVYTQAELKIKNSKISKIQNSTFVRTTEEKNQEKFERIQKRFEGGVAF